MPKIEVNQVNLYYELHGSGEETIVFSHGLLWSGRMFHKQVEALKNRYRILVYDHRGQGRSEVTATGYEMDNQMEDAAQLIEKLGLGPCHFVGLSMGGFVAMRLAVYKPELIQSITLMETSADAEPPENIPKYHKLGKALQWLGPWAVAKPVMKIMFSQKFREDASRKEERKYWRKQFTANKRSIVKALGGVTGRKSFFEELKKIQCPTLIMVGDQDTATVPAKSERMHSQIPQSKLVYIQGGGHSSSIEEPEQVNQAILEFLENLET